MANGDAYCNGAYQTELVFRFAACLVSGFLLCDLAVVVWVEETICNSPLKARYEIPLPKQISKTHEIGFVGRSGVSSFYFGQ